MELATEFEGDDAYHRAIRGTLRSSRSGREWTFTGSVMNLITLRRRRQAPDGNQLVTRNGGGLTEWTIADGRMGYGLSEYLDQIVDGRPVGLAE